MDYSMREMVPRCSLTNMRHKDSIVSVESAHVIPPTMLDGIELANEGRLLRILEAFLTPSYVAEPRAHLSGEVKNDEIYLKNLWLLTPSIHKAFRGGHVSMKLQTYKTVKRVEEKEIYGLYRLFPEGWYNLYLGDGKEWRDNLLFT
ncbi:hypothetical protein OCU04_009029 [Sclerotinia nivalis]|uniref:Uncharacterized protein n=1 Tax=Sclerotinia nivalis TaxID=352851 RepID=A0A9X0AHL1_9HELO|nr:hypothetical protein OCU04_009029 [Sclerotinia nivalis]